MTSHDAELQRFERRGVVVARQLAGPIQWETRTGDRLSGAAGDWWVEGDDGVGRSVTDAEFRQSYEAVGCDRYRRVGHVHARRVEAGEEVETLEGRVRALPGMWVVIGARGNAWVVPDDEFRSGYVPAPPV